MLKEPAAATPRAAMAWERYMREVERRGIDDPAAARGIVVTPQTTGAAVGLSRMRAGE